MWSCWARRSIWPYLGRITTGEVFTFSMLFLSVMAPMSELHRLLDEGHETSLLVGDLLDLMAEPVDQSFSTKPNARHNGADNASARRPAIVAESICRSNIDSDEDERRGACTASRWPSSMARRSASPDVREAARRRFSKSCCG